MKMIEKLHLPVKGKLAKETIPTEKTQEKRRSRKRKSEEGNNPIF